VLGDRPGDAPHPRLVLSAHLDTVFPEETNVKVTRRGQHLEGPGIGDNCRGLAVLVAVIRSMNQAHVRTPGTVTFVADVGEEGLGDLRGMKALFGETMKGQIDRFVSLDNADPHVTIIGVGSHRYRITFKGPGGHSFADFGLPNPANALGRAVARIAEFQVTDTLRTTFNVGRIGGGTSVNAIPSEAWMEVDLRSSDSAALSALDAKLRQAVDKAVVEENARWGSPGVITVVTDLVGDRPAGSISEDAPIVATALATPSSGSPQWDQRRIDRRQHRDELEYSRDRNWRRWSIDERSCSPRSVRRDRLVARHGKRPAAHDCARALACSLLSFKK
jgi:acetylornithine deacetylase/succinyl-diaminopimelate desuccinylase-like protein